MPSNPSEWVGEEEALALADLRRRTGRSFVRFQSAVVTTQDEAEEILPVIMEWAQKGTGPMRAAAITCLNNQFIRPHLDFLLDRWQAETDGLTSDLIVQRLAKWLDNRHATRAWEISQTKDDPSTCHVLVRLCRFKSTEALAKQAILAEFARGRVPYNRLVAYSRVRDTRIIECYREYVGDKNRQVRSLARRVLGMPVITVPPEVVRAPGGPPREEPDEVYSVEVDVDEVGLVLEEISKRYSMNLSSAILSGEFFDSLQVNRWYSVRGELNRSDFSLWFRMEDVDIVEIVVTTRTDAGTAGV